MPATTIGAGAPGCIMFVCICVWPTQAAFDPKTARLSTALFILADGFQYISFNVVCLSTVDLKNHRSPTAKCAFVLVFWSIKI